MRTIIVALLLSLSLAQNDPILPSTEWTYISQADFINGTYFISTPGYYRLTSDIEFDPLAPTDASSASNAYFPPPSSFTSHGGIYDEQTYQIGFWNAISVLTNHVTIDLNGYTIGQTTSHNLMNRFFNVIQLGGLYSNGYYQFAQPDANFPIVEYITIQNGRIGRTATNGIYGSFVNYIQIQGVTFDGFEKSAVAFDGSTSIDISNCVASSSTSVPVNQFWATALNIHSYIDSLVSISPNYTLTVGGTPVSVSTIQSNLESTINLVYQRVVTQNSWLDGSSGYEEVSALFGNDWRLPDSNCVAFAFGPILHPGTGIFSYSSDINITDCGVYNLQCAPRETVGISTSTIIGISNGISTINYVPIRDAQGGALALLDFDWDWTKPSVAFGDALSQSWDTVTIQSAIDLSQAIYKGNVVTNAQAIVGQAILDNTLVNSNLLQTSLSSFNSDILAWMAADPSSSAALLATYMQSGTLSKRPFICSGDAFLTPLQGVYGFSFSSVTQVNIIGTTIVGTTNLGAKGSGVCLYHNSTKIIPGAFFTGYNGADAKGFFFAETQNVTLQSINVEDTTSNFGSIVIFDILSSSAFFSFYDVQVSDGYSGQYLTAEDQPSWENQPTFWPSAIAFHTDSSSKGITLNPYCVNNLNAPTGNTFTTSLFSNSTVDDGETFTCHIGDYPWWIWLVLAFVALIFIIALLAVIMSCLEQKKEPEGEHYTQMNE